MVSRALNMALRAVQFFCALFVMALIGDMMANSTRGDPAIVNYDMFVAVIAMLSLLYLLPTAFLDDYSLPAVNMGLDTLNVIFWFCAAVATAAYLGAHSCSNERYTRFNRITNGSLDREKRCREAQAATAFLWFGLIAFVVSMVFSILTGRRSASLGGGLGSSLSGSRRGPAMSQV